MGNIVFILFSPLAIPIFMLIHYLMFSLLIKGR